MASRGRLAGAALNANLSGLCKLGFRVQRQLAEVLPEESGSDIGYREHASIQVAFTMTEADTLKSDIPSLVSDDSTLRYLEVEALRQLEPWLNHASLGGEVYIKPRSLPDAMWWRWPRWPSVMEQNCVPGR